MLTDQPLLVNFTLETGIPVSHTRNEYTVYDADATRARGSPLRHMARSRSQDSNSLKFNVDV